MNELQAIKTTKPRHLSPRLVVCIHYTGWVGGDMPRESARLARVLTG
jgi:hypothetical protein